jgi:hypothetical protein
MAMDIDSVLNVMRQEHAPSPADQARVRAAISAALVVGGAAQLGATAGAKGFSVFKGASWAVPVWVKGTVGLGAAMAAVGGGVYGMRQSSTTPTDAGSNVAALEAQATSRVAATPALDEKKLSETRVPDTQVPRVEARPSETPRSEAETATLHRQGNNSLPEVTTPIAAAKTAPARPTTAKLGAAADVGHTTTSLDELRLLGEASKALREGQTEQARTVLSEHERRYSNTALAPERAGLDLLARCTDSPSSDVRRAAVEFLRRSPNSPLAGNIRRKCLE